MTIAAGRQLFRSLTNESEPAVLPDIVMSGEVPVPGGQGVDTYLQLGLEEFSRQVGGYAIRDHDETDVPVSGRFGLPADCVDVLAVWITEGAMLKRTSLEELLATKRNWATETDAAPEDYVVKGNDLMVFPRSTAANVDLTLRYIAAPGAYATAGFEQIAAQDHALPVYYAAALFIQLHNDVPEMQARAKSLMELFLLGCKGAAPFYDRKRMPGRRTP